MEKIKCPECKKIIEGYTLNHANFLLSQHTYYKHKHKKKLKKIMKIH